MSADQYVLLRGEVAKYNGFFILNRKNCIEELDCLSFFFLTDVEPVNQAPLFKLLVAKVEDVVCIEKAVDFISLAGSQGL